MSGAGTPSGRKVLLYFAWNHPDEAQAPLFSIEDRFPALFELRRLFYPRYEALAASNRIDQGISGFLDHVQKENFAEFAEQCSTLSGNPVARIERVSRGGQLTLLDTQLTSQADTLVVISFDSVRTRQAATVAEIAAVREFLAVPDHLVFVCPHHDIGNSPDPDPARRTQRQELEYLHHGDIAIPPRQAFGHFATTLLAGLGLPVENRHGLRPAVEADGTPSPLELDRARDELSLLRGVDTFNAHPHLPHLARIGEGLRRMDVLARQKIDPSAPPHPFTGAGHATFDALLQSTPATFAGKVLVCDTTIFSSRAGGLDSLRKFWSNIVLRPRRD